VPLKAQAPFGLAQEGLDGLPEYPVVQATAVHVPAEPEAAVPVHE